MATAVYSLESVKMGAAGANGVMGSSLSDITQIAAGTLTMNFPEPTKTDIIPEEGETAFVSLKEAQSKTIEFESLNMDVDALAVLFGGAVVTGTFTPGASFSMPDQSFQFTTRVLSGKKQTWKFPKVSVSGSFSGSLSKTDVLKLKYTITVLQPYDVEGAALPEFTVVQA